MNQQQLDAAMANMREWLSDPQELGKAPSKIECAGQFEYKEMTYYIFKFKTGLLGKWLLGVCGGFEEGETEPCGHTYSEMQPYEEASAQQDCIKMIDKIVAYWQQQAQTFQ